MKASLLTALLAAVAIAVVGVAANSIGSSSTTRSASLSSDEQLDRALKTARSAARRARAAKRTAARALVAATGPRGPTGPTGPRGLTGPTGAQGPIGASPVDGSLPSGVTVTGTWYAELRHPTGGGALEVTTSLPARAPLAIGSENVGFAPGAEADTYAMSDQLPTHCSGTLAAPTAGAGFVCLYIDSAAMLNVNTTGNGLTGVALDPAGGPAEANRSGFTIVVQTPSSGLTAPTDETRVGGTWAYTVP